MDSSYIDQKQKLTRYSQEIGVEGAESQFSENEAEVRLWRRGRNISNKANLCVGQ